MRAPMRQSLRVVVVAGAVWATAAVAVLAPRSAWALALLLWIACAVAVLSVAVRSVTLRRRRRDGRRTAWVVAVLALALAAAAASQVASAAPSRAAAAGLPISGGRAIVVEAVVSGKVEPFGPDRAAFDAVASEVVIGSVSHRLSVPIAIRVPREIHPVGLDVGAHVRVRGTARPADAGERAVLEVSASEVDVRSSPGGAVGAAGALRRDLVEASAALPGDGGALLPGLAVGDTSRVPEGLDAAMKTSSLAHLTAVSGANCALVVGVAAQLAALAGAGRRTRIAVGMLVLGGFVLLVTPEPSVVRAAAMAATAMTAMLLGRRAAGLAVLSLAIGAILVADPWLALSLGFALSAAATAALLVLARPLAVGLSRVLPRSLALMTAVPLAAQLACGPLLVLIAPVVPIQGITANVLAEPAAPLATVLGLLACLSAPIPVLQSGLAALAWLPAAWIAATARAMAALPAQLPWIAGWSGAALLAFAGGVVVVAVVPGRGRRWARWRRAAALALALAVGVASGGAALRSVLAPLELPSQWSILACDVGQGDAVLLRSAGVVALVDTGPDPAPLRTCLAQAGIERISLLVLTHYDADHVGGLDAVVGRVDTALHGPPADAADSALLARLTGGGAHVVAATRGMEGTLGDARWRIEWPPALSAAFPSGNDASVTVDIQGGGVPHTLLLGDLSQAPQAAIRRSGELAPRYDVVKVAHHGSADQDAGLYGAIRAAVGIISVGERNDYGHPRAETLALLAQAGTRVVRTDRDGRVALWLSDGAVTIWRERRERRVPPIGVGGAR